MNPTFIQGYDNFDIAIRDACGYRKPYCVIGGKIKRTPLDNFYVGENKTEVFENIAGKGKLCKGAGLTGSEKNACKKNIISQCGHKPLCILTPNCKKKKASWEQCASGTIVSPEDQAQQTAEKLVPETVDTGISLEAKIAIGAAIIGTIGLIGFGVMRARKNAMSQPLSISR